MDLLVLATEASSQGSDSGFTMPLWGWVAFLAVLIALLLFDLLILHRDAHVVGPKEAGTWSAIWIGLGILFAGVVFALYPDGGSASLDYLSGFFIEKSLSVDNLFVFVLIFQYFSVPPEYQHRVLFWGILGAFVFRGIFIALGAVLLSQFSWIAYLFGAFLLFTAYKLATTEEIEVHPENNPILKAFRRTGRVTDDFDGQNILTRRNGQIWATPLAAVLVVIETTDVVFAVDSIPAIFAVTRDPFLVFSSNAFALLGLRALFFLLADAVRRFTYLDKGIAIVLGLVGVKMIVEEAELAHIPAWSSLVVILVILGGAVWLSLRGDPDALAEATGHGPDTDADGSREDVDEPASG